MYRFFLNCIIICVVVIFLPASLLAQKIDNTASFRDINSSEYFRFNYDNDFFASADQNYTQGYSFELVASGLRKNPLNIILLKPQHSRLKHGFALEHIGFTPYNIVSPEVQFGDRPFAAAIMLKSFLIATDTIHGSRWTSAISLGIIGPGAFGKEMQVGIHQLTGNKIPFGWQNQIRNDIVINYELSYEKQVLDLKGIFLLKANASARAGTLFTNATVGVNGMLGLFKPAGSAVGHKAFKLYIYSQPQLNIIGYDATLQGGFFSGENRYVIPANSIERLTAQYNYGIVIQSKTLYFEYSRSEITQEFASGGAAKWGGIKFGFTF